MPLGTGGMTLCVGNLWKLPVNETWIQQRCEQDASEGTMGRTEERISGLEERTMENALTWTAERKRRTKGPAEPHGP